MLCQGRNFQKFLTKMGLSTILYAKAKKLLVKTLYFAKLKQILTFLGEIPIGEKGQRSFKEMAFFTSQNKGRDIKGK